MPLLFEILARGAAAPAARAGRVTTPHGFFDTPAFMPVGTRGSVKGVLPEMVAATAAQILLANTYHLLLRPGEDAVAALGGLHRFMGWPGPILTDSGGYQAFSMSHITRLSDDGVTFKSIIDGSPVTLTPERAIHVQNLLGADIIMALDDCPPSVAADHRPLPAHPFRARARVVAGDLRARVREANERTVRWLERCAAANQRPADQALFGIVQGGTDPDARVWSAERVCAIDLPGYAIGGVAVGEGSAEIAATAAHTAALLPPHKPRYLMGVGYERDIVAAVLAGVDMFDCVLPTRNGRNAYAFTPGGPIRLRNAVHADDPGPIDPACDCPACSPSPAVAGGLARDSHFSRAYIRYLFMAREMLGPILVTLHNLRHFQRLMTDIRQTIREDDWAGFALRWPVAAAGMPAELRAPQPPRP